MLSLSEILSNKKEVVFSFGEDTISIFYKPYALKGGDLNRLLVLSKRADLKKPEKLIDKIIWKIRKYPKTKLYKKFLEKIIISWDLTDGENEVGVKEGLDTLPVYFLHDLYWKMSNEIITATRQTIGAELKKK